MSVLPIYIFGALPGKPVACNLRLLCFNDGLLLGDRGLLFWAYYTFRLGLLFPGFG